ncbi:MAG: YDG domain-containing protein, partial [Fusobacteria bacterium]|nr:YDG domain-containing protein [Fusobacteriota bacterium]
MKKRLFLGSVFLFLISLVLLISSGLFADTLGYFSPNSYSDNDSVSNPDSVYTSNNSYATLDKKNDDVTYSFGTQFSGIPVGAIITGIEVSVEGSTTGRDVSITLIDNNSVRGSKTIDLSGTENTYAVGSSSDDWYSGGSWTVSDFTTNNNFKLKLDAESGGGTASIDHIQVRVHYTIPATAPTVTTNTPATSITNTSASAGGNVTADGGATVTARGIDVSTSNSFSTFTSYPAASGGTGSFSVNLTGLVQNTTYYYRAYATNSQGTSYGSNGTFKTRTTPAITNYTGTYDGNSHGITVGNTIAGDTVYYSLDNSTWSTTPITITDVTSGTTVYVKVSNANYNDWFGNGAVTINAKGLTISGLTAENKIYNGNATAGLNFGSATLSGVVSGDNVSLDDDSYIANFNNKNVGDDKPVTISSIDLVGTDKGNYSLTLP